MARISKYASHLPPLLRVIDFDLAEETKQDVERVAAWINSQPYAERTKLNTGTAPLQGGRG